MLLSNLEFVKKRLKIVHRFSNDQLIDFEYNRLKEIIEKGKIKPLYDIDIFNISEKYQKK